MNALELMRHLATKRAKAIGNRRSDILAEARTAHVNANLYASMGLYSVSARERIKAVEYETLARNLTLETINV